MDFASWIQQELDKRGWDQAELARRSGVRPGSISRVMSRERSAGPDFCIALARGLNLPREEVFRARGWLLREPEQSFGPEMDVRVRRLAEEVNALSFKRREAAMNALEAVLASIRAVGGEDS
jgi:transcriptional regulator with XRE-family HTH domain